MYNNKHFVKLLCAKVINLNNSGYYITCHMVPIQIIKQQTVWLVQKCLLLGKKDNLQMNSLDTAVCFGMITSQVKLSSSS